MRNKILITGPPRIGKTTLIKKLVEALKPVNCAGFYTSEIKQGGTRRGFELIDLNGRKAILSHIDIKSPHRVGKYGVDLESFENFLSGITFLDPIVRFVVIDEIGKMECYSPVFNDIIRELFDSGKTVTASIALKGGGLIAEIKKRPDIQLFEMTSSNRDSLFYELQTMFKT